VLAGAVAFALASTAGGALAWLVGYQDATVDLGVGVKLCLRLLVGVYQNTGDGATSELGASLFFDTLDADADGQIEREEYLSSI